MHLEGRTAGRHRRTHLPLLPSGPSELWSRGGHTPGVLPLGSVPLRVSETL